MQATIINIGDELLIGQVLNTNASRMSQHLTAAGVAVRDVITIADDAEAIRNAVADSEQHSHIVLITGGLGPTKDDITKTTLCELYGSELYENAEALANVRRIFDARGYQLTEVNRRQAWVPRCCTMINNDVGTAPCMWFDRKMSDGSAAVTVSMAGVPHEMEYLMDNKIMPLIRQQIATGAIVCKNLLVQGIGESFLSDLIEPWELSLPANAGLAYLPQSGMVKLRLTARGSDTDTDEMLQSEIESLLPGLYKLAGEYILGEDCETLAELTAKELTDKGLTLATAESCTGGAIASGLTQLAGASQYFRGSVVAYCNEVKEAVLGVSHDTLARHTAVSEPVARQMAEGARALLGSDIAVATTGIAGPTGGTPENPVGTVWLAISTPAGTQAKCLHCGDRRQQNIARAANQAYAWIIRETKTLRK